MRAIPFSTVQEINKNAGNRNITLFSRGATAGKTIRLLDHFSITGLVDNASNLWGQREFGLEIQNPEAYFKTEDGRSNYIVICTTSFAEVSEQLLLYGLVPRDDFSVSPVLNDLRIIAELESIEKKLIFSSGSPPNETSNRYGGGIYELNVCGDQLDYRKVISGYCYGIIQVGDTFYSVDSERGIFEFDRDYHIIRQGKLPQGTRAHGIAYSDIHNKFYIVGSYLDKVLMLDENFIVTDEIKISNKIDSSGEPHHHCNDCFVKDNSLYVSMFSQTGNWKLEVYDGAVIEFDLATKTKIGPVMQDLWMPHNISYWDGSLTVLDSLPGYLKKNNNQVCGQFPSFTRGLAYDGIHYYIGQSKNRNFSKSIGVSLNTAIDAGIVIFDESTKVSRTLQLPPKVSEIHSIVLLES